MGYFGNITVRNVPRCGHGKLRCNLPPFSEFNQHSWGENLGGGQIGQHSKEGRYLGRGHLQVGTDPGGLIFGGV